VGAKLSDVGQGFTLIQLYQGEYPCDSSIENCLGRGRISHENFMGGPLLPAQLGEDVGHHYLRGGFFSNFRFKGPQSAIQVLLLDHFHAIIKGGKVFADEVDLSGHAYQTLLNQRFDIFFSCGSQTGFQLFEQVVRDLSA
jgi:hypothetical protein